MDDYPEHAAATFEILGCAQDDIRGTLGIMNDTIIILLVLSLPAGGMAFYSDQ